MATIRRIKISTTSLIQKRARTLRSSHRNPSSSRGFTRIQDLIDQHKPDLVYTDGGVFGQIGRDLIAYYYNANMSWHNGNQEAVYTVKYQRPGGKTGEYQEGAGTRDL